MQLFYNETLHQKSTEFVFDTIESKHIIRVLRKKEGDLVHITNGKNLLFEGKIISANAKKCQVQIIQITSQKATRNYTVSIGIAPTKSISRFEWFLEKATEIGVDAIYPIKCEHSERKFIKLERLNKVLQTAMKQSLQCKLPVLHELMSFKELLTQKFTAENTSKLIATCDFTKKKNRSLQTTLKQSSNILILIGPEGGFSPAEKEFALQNSFIPVSLGSNRLRTETAGMLALHTVSLVNQ